MKRILSTIKIEVYVEEGQLRCKMETENSMSDVGEGDDVINEGIPEEIEWLRKEMLYFVSTLDVNGIVRKQWEDGDEMKK